MSAQSPEQEPSIEEILASIRQIISDDDEGPSAASAEPEPVLKPAPPPPPPPPAPKPKEDVLVLKDPLPNARPVIDMEDSFPEEEEELEEEDSSPPPRLAPAPDMDSILTDTARSAALSGFSRLASNIPMERGTTPQHSSGGATLEDIVRDMLNPMLREWLDENLPGIIEKLVQKELEKLARRASDD